MKANMGMSEDRARIFYLERDSKKIDRLIEAVKKFDVDLFYRAKDTIFSVKEGLEVSILAAKEQYELSKGRRESKKTRMQRDCFESGNIIFY